MLAAAKDRRIAALALVATPGVTGAELNLEQVKHALDRTNRSAADKQATIELQKKIQQAVLTGTGWEPLAAYRKQADTPWFQSFLAFDPAKVMRDIRQPVLIVQGELDTQVAPANAGRLEALAGQRKNRPAAQVVRVRGVNHLLVTRHHRRSRRVSQPEGQARQRGSVQGDREAGCRRRSPNEHVDSADVRT